MQSGHQYLMVNGIKSCLTDLALLLWKVGFQTKSSQSLASLCSTLPWKQSRCQWTWFCSDIPGFAHLSHFWKRKCKPLAVIWVLGVKWCFLKWKLTIGMSQMVWYSLLSEGTRLMDFIHPWVYIWIPQGSVFVLLKLSTMSFADHVYTFCASICHWLTIFFNIKWAQYVSM